MHKAFNHATVRIVLFGLCMALLASCGGRRIGGDRPAESSEGAASADSSSKEGDKDKRIENLISALSRAQTRIEELDAKVSALTDKVDATRLAVDNVAGNKPLKTEAVGSAQASNPLTSKEPDHEHQASATPSPSIYHSGVISDFTKAMALFKAGKYTDAELAFNHFTEQYPENVLAGSAQFYSGESYFMMGEYKLAMNEYAKVISAFSSSPRVASATVRLAHCQDAIGAKKEAMKTLALARDVFFGNPALDMTPPVAIEGARTAHSSTIEGALDGACKLGRSSPTAHSETQEAVAAKKAELNIAPIEPKAEEPKSEKNQE